MATLPPDNIEGVESGAGTLTVGSDGLMSREVELRFLVRSMEGYSDAEDKGRELAPLYYDGHRRGTLQCRPVGGGWYQISVNYSNSGVNAYVYCITIAEYEFQSLGCQSIEILQE